MDFVARIEAVVTIVPVLYCVTTISLLFGRWTQGSFSFQTYFIRLFTNGIRGCHRRTLRRRNKYLCSVDIIHLQINKLLPIYFIHTKQCTFVRTTGQKNYIKQFIFADTFYSMKLCDAIFFLFRMK